MELFDAPSLGRRARAHAVSECGGGPVVRITIYAALATDVSKHYVYNLNLFKKIRGSKVRLMTWRA